MTGKAGNAILLVSGGHPGGNENEKEGRTKQNEPGAERPPPGRA